MKNKFNIFSALMFLIMGSLLASNQILINNITKAFNATPGQMGYMISAMYIGSTAMVLVFGELAEHIGKRMAGALASSFIGLGALFVCLAPNVWFVVIGLVIYSAGFGGFESTILSLITDKNGERANNIINLVQAVFSFGAMLSPLLIQIILPDDQYRIVYVIILAVYASLSCYFFMNRSIDTFAVKNVNLRGITIFRLVRNPVMVLYMIAMITFVGMESACTYWISGFFSWHGFESFGGYALSIYWLSSIVGRLVASRVNSPARLAVPCFVLSAISALVMILVPGLAGKAAAFFVLGMANGPLYSGLSLLGGILYPDHSAAAFALMIFSGGFGGIIFQLVISRLVSSGNQNSVYFLVAGAFAAMAVLMFFTNRRTEKLKTKTS